MPVISGQLEELEIPLENLFLDPNNPRYADLGDAPRYTPEDRVLQEQVQERALGRMLDARFDVQQLKDSIRNIGFLHVDRLVVVELPQQGNYMVIEGNRRLAALKSLVDEQGEGDELPEEIRNSITNVPALIIRHDNRVERDRIARTLQGVRHISSIKTWGPYQQAQLIATMIEEGMTLREIKEVLGLSAQRINQLRRVFFALAQMRQDPDYGEDAKPQLFSHFDEALKQPALRTWLGWSDEQNLCLNNENRLLFYSWCVGMEEDGERQPTKIVDAKHLRSLPDLISDPVQFRRFRDDSRLTLSDAARQVVHEEPEIDWRGILRNNLVTLRQVPALDIRQASDQDVSLLEDVNSACTELLAIARPEQIDDNAAVR